MDKAYLAHVTKDSFLVCMVLKSGRRFYRYEETAKQAQEIINQANLSESPDLTPWDEGEPVYGSPAYESQNCEHYQYIRERQKAGCY